jgi:hypothetical protein
MAYNLAICISHVMRLLGTKIKPTTIVHITTISFAIMLVTLGTANSGVYKANAQLIFPGSPNSEKSGDKNEPISNLPSSAPSSGLDAKQIAATHSMKVDGDIKNLVILIPNPTLTDQKFLPMDATIVKGTKAIWVNGISGTTQGIVLQDAKGGKTLLSNSSIPYRNATDYTFDKKGVYTFTSPQSPTAKGTITVVDKAGVPDDPLTNATQVTAGLFVVPAADKGYFDKHFSTLGYHKVGTTTIKKSAGAGTSGEDTLLYVYTQKLGKYPSVVDRTSIKLGFLQSKVQ